MKKTPCLQWRDRAGISPTSPLDPPCRGTLSIKYLIHHKEQPNHIVIPSFSL